MKHAEWHSIVGSVILAVCTGCDYQASPTTPDASTGRSTSGTGGSTTGTGTPSSPTTPPSTTQPTSPGSPATNPANNPPGTPGTGNAATDERLAQSARDAITNSGTGAGDIQVSARDGVITVRGTASSTAERDSIVQAIKRVSGVRDVVDQLTVPPR